MGNTDYFIHPINGGFTLISIDDAELIKGYDWFADSDGYATAFTYGEGKSICIRMHQLICPRQEGMCVDHANRVRLDNRRSNLRNVTFKEQYSNRGTQEKGTDTPYTDEELLFRKRTNKESAKDNRIKDLRTYIFPPRKID